MKVKVDENIPVEVLDDVRGAGHDGDSVQDEGLAGAPDPIILDRARAEKRVLLTLDKGLGELRAYPPNQFSGIILLRPPSSGREATLSFARQYLPSLLAQDLEGHLVVVTDPGLRWR